MAFSCSALADVQSNVDAGQAARHLDNLVAVPLAKPGAQPILKATRLRLERRPNPLYVESNQNLDVLQGVDVPYPAFSWNFEDTTLPSRAVSQARYHLIVTEITPAPTPAARQLVWCDSGVVESSASLHVRCENAARPLRSGTTYEWKVKVWDASSPESSESEWAVARFHTAHVAPQQFTGAWIGSPDGVLNEFRREFNATKPISQANVYISGLGYYQLYINGQNVDATRKLDPAWTTFEKTVLYASFDVTRLIAQGTNAIGIQMGNGWYSQQQYLAPSQGEPTYGPPRVIFQLNVTYTDGSKISVLSNKTGWTGRAGPIILDSVYDGETYDARLERPGWSTPGFKDNTSLWLPLSEVPSPGGVLKSQLMEPIRITGLLPPKSINQDVMNAYVVDFGQNFAGWVRFNITGRRGTAIHVRYGEILEQQSSGIYSYQIYTDNLRSASATDVYILKGGGKQETYEPRFTVHGFRYANLQAWTGGMSADDIIGVVVNSAVEPVGNISFPSYPILNGIQHLVQWGQKSNLMSVPSDCPQRDERKGWMGDAGLTVDESMFNYNGVNFYENFMNDIADIQGSDGTLTDTVPWTFGGRPADPSWGTAYPTILYMHYNHYGDKSIVQAHYPNVKAWVDYLTSRATQSGLGRMYFSYSDWVPPPPHPATNGSLVAAFSYMNDVNTIISLANLLGNQADVATYKALYSKLATEFHAAFYNPAVNGYADGIQTANTLALYLPNVVPPSVRNAVINSLLADIAKNNGHLTTGIIGTRFLMLTLSFVLNRTDVALQIATQSDYPSWGYMWNNTLEPATTLWERWDSPQENPGMNSRNHIMFGSVGAWFYRALAGIDPNALGEIQIHPRVAGISQRLSHVNAHYDSLKGRIAVEWTWTAAGASSGAKLLLRVQIPHNTNAAIHVPTVDPIHGIALHLSEGGQAVYTNKDGITASGALPAGINQVDIRREDQVFVVRVESGVYEFLAVFA